MNLYVGNLARDVTDDDLRTAFEAYGKVISATMIKDKFSGESRGFGFVEMPEKAEAEAAMNALNGKELKGRTIVVNEARPREERRTFGGPSSSGQRRGGGYRGGGDRRKGGSRW